MEGKNNKKDRVCVYITHLISMSNFGSFQTGREGGDHHRRGKRDWS